jgi:hypothetical protein
MNADRPDAAPEPSRSGPLIAMLLAFAVLCAGSVGGAGYFAWRAYKNAADRAEERRLDEQHAPAPKDGPE